MPKAIVLLGATSSGKSELAMLLANKSSTDFGIPIEIVVADSMQVYKGMNIGTAKPTIKEQEEVKHHCLDLTEPTQDFSVELYQKAATQVLEADVLSSSPNILIVGGTGLYIRSIVDGLQIPPQYFEVRKELEAEKNTESLWQKLNELDPIAAATMLPTNRRRILRALEVTVGSGKPFSSFGKGMKEYGDTNFLQVGIRMPREILDRRIDDRYNAQMEAGFLDEVKALKTKDLSRASRQALGYKELLAYLDNDLSLEEALLKARQRTKRFARRQERWFRRDPRIQWIDCEEPQSIFPEILKLYQDYFGLN